MQDWAQDPEKDKVAQEKEAEEKETKIERDDPEELQKTRAFDDWKDGTWRRFIYCVLYILYILLYILYIYIYIYTSCFTSCQLNPVRIRVRIDPPHPLMCRKRRLNGAVLRMRPEKPRPRGTIKIPPCSKALSAEHRPKFRSPSPAMLTSPYK
jgi:hypothetical protein